MNEERIDEINESHIGRVIKYSSLTADAYQWVKLINIDGNEFWCKGEDGYHYTNQTKGPWILKPLPTPKKRPSERIDEIFKTLPGFVQTLEKAIVVYLDEMAEKE